MKPEGNLQKRNKNKYNLDKNNHKKASIEMTNHVKVFSTDVIDSKFKFHQAEKEASFSERSVSLGYLYTLML